MRCLIYFGTIEEVFPEMCGHGAMGKMVIVCFDHGASGLQEVDTMRTQSIKYGTIQKTLGAS